MMEMEKPTVICDNISADGRYAKFIVKPLEKGFGQTLGNSLRRILLSSLPGAAAIAIRIPGVPHEFSTIKGVKEDVNEIILNIKSIVFKTISTNESFMQSLYIRKSGAGEVTARDIIEDAEVEVLNPDQHICTLDNTANLDLEILVGRGRGYVSADNNKQRLIKESVDYIAVDSLYTPTKRVNYTVEQTRVGQSIDFEMLTLEVETNGGFSAKEITSLAAKILNEHVSLFVELSETMSGLNVLQSKVEDGSNKSLDQSIDVLELSARPLNSLKRSNILTINELLKYSEDDLLKFRSLGKKSVDDIIEKLNSLGLSLKNNEE